MIQHLTQWKEALPRFGGKDLHEDFRAFSEWYHKGNGISNEQINEVSTFQFQHVLAVARGNFIAKHGEEIYAGLTSNFGSHIRIEELIYEIADAYKGLAPTRSEIEADNQLALPEKEGYEISQGLIIGELVALPKVGKHLMASMRFPKKESLERLSDFKQSGFIELETVKLEKKEGVGYLTISNAKYLNAEDDQLNNDMELATDLVLLDDEIQIGVMRGDRMTHRKYFDKHVFCSGINLTKLYQGKLSYLYYATRELALMSKLFRGILDESFDWEQRIDHGIEKPWIAAVDTHAIGGGAQLVLVADIVVADHQSYFTIPARTEGFIPGFANFRLQRFIGQGLARKMINYNHKVLSNSEEGRLLVDEVVKVDEMEEAIERIT
ncbi:MAG: enoyl-CoA hydratase/isomerase family protein, partial [Crocinitomicaceae bacterium]